MTSPLRKRMIVIGVSGSGKSTFTEKLRKQNNLSICDIRDFVIEVIRSDGNNDIGSKLEQAYIDMFNSKQFEESDILEIAPDYVGSVVYDIINSYKKDTECIIVLIKTPFIVCIERQQGRENPTPEYRIREQYNNIYALYCLLEPMWDVVVRIEGNIDFDKQIESNKVLCDFMKYFEVIK